MVTDKVSLLIQRSIFIGSKCSQHLNSVLADIGLSYSEYLALKILFEQDNDALSRAQLAKEIGLTASGITRLLAPLEEYELVEKVEHPRDARKSMVGLTVRGQNLYIESKSLVDESCHELFSNLNANEKRLLGLYLKKVSFS